MAESFLCILYYADEVEAISGHLGIVAILPNELLGKVHPGMKEF